MVAWYLTYPCWYGPDDIPIAVFAGPFTSRTMCEKFQARMGVFVGAIVLSETLCDEVSKPRLPSEACPDDKKED